MRKSFTDPITRCMLEAVEMNIEVPEERFWWGRKLGYSDDEIRQMWWSDKRSPKYINAIQEKPLSQVQSDRLAARGLTHN